MKVGLVLPMADADAEDAATWGWVRALAREAEAVGVDSLWLADHLIIRAVGQPEEGVREAWTTMAALAAVTRTAGIGTLVTATPFRAPALLAKMAATLDEISGGRLILGLGCGWHEPELRAFGLPADHLASRFEEALAVILALIRGERVTHAGRWFRLDDAVLLPPPRWSIRPSSGIPILVAAMGHRMMRTAARHADAWNTNGYGWPGPLFESRLDEFRRACDEERRDPATVEVTAGVEVAMSPASRARDGALPADPAALAGALGAWESRGVRHVQLTPLPASLAAIDVVGEALRRFRAR